jgi:hypothetical protein
VPLVLCVGTVQASVAVPVLEEEPVPVPEEVPVPVPEEVPVPVPAEVPEPVPEDVPVPVPAEVPVPEGVPVPVLEEVPVEEDVVEEDVAAEVEASGPAPTTPQADKQQMVAINAANRVAATLFPMRKTMGVFQYAQGIRANCRQLVTVLPRVERDAVLRQMMHIPLHGLGQSVADAMCWHISQQASRFGYVCQRMTDIACPKIAMDRLQVGHVCESRR